MSNFSIHFSYPWLLLLLIPALFFTLFPYFRLKKRYRRTRNRIVSMTLHMLIMLLTVATLSGILFLYDEPNLDNEVILLVDTSYSGRNQDEEKNEFLRTVIDQSAERYKVGVVTFGYNQVYASELSRDPDEVYENYLEADSPDDSATDIASALTYAKGLFTNPEGAKIVLVSDGIETDGSAASVIRAIAAEGVRVDTVHFPANFHEDEVELVQVNLPEYNLTPGVPFELSVSLLSSYEGHAQITLYDNDEASTASAGDFTVGMQEFTFSHQFDHPGLHRLRFEVTGDGDTLTQNNRLDSYIFLQVFNRLLVIERYDDESAALTTLFETDDYFNEKGGDYQVNVVNVTDADKMPKTLDELREYDEVIMMNIANADLPEGFDEILNSYVYDYGGGLFTTGGNRLDEASGQPELDEYGDYVPNAYNREDMRGTLYQQMLPVQAINYTPPLGVVIIIDISGSMQSPSTSMPGKTKLEAAQDGALDCLNALSERDYVGVMTLADTYVEELELTPMTHRAEIEEAIDGIPDDGGSTNFRPSLMRAGTALMSTDKVQRKHIILVTDAQPGDSLETDYGPQIQMNYEAGITLSIVAIEAGGKTQDMLTACEMGHGRFIDVDDISRITFYMREDLTGEDIKSVDPQPFIPQIKDRTEAVSGLKQESMPEVGGYYGTRVKSEAVEPLTAGFVPLYAQWKYGEGMVGSFMSDLNGTWSRQFLDSPTGTRFLFNVTQALFPTKDIRSREIDVTLLEDNYGNQLNIFTSIEEGNSVEVVISGPMQENGVFEKEEKIAASAADGFSRVTFPITKSGVYQITVRKTDLEGNVTEYSIYKAFSYSEEYQTFRDDEQCAEFLAMLAERGKGQTIPPDEVWRVFEGFQDVFHRQFDPRLLFIILAIVFFLLDIAVRKFKFKWLHEIVREHKEKKKGGPTSRKKEVEEG